MQSEHVMQPEPQLVGVQEQVAPSEHEEHEEEFHPHLSPQSVWPISMAAGIALVGTGAVTMWPISFLGLFIMVVSLVFWIQELRHEPH